MQMWFYKCERDFRYPIPAEFDFAYIDRSGKRVIDGPFSVAYGFHGGLAVVSMGCYAKSGNGWRFVPGSHENYPAVVNQEGAVKPLPGKPVDNYFENFRALINTPPSEEDPHGDKVVIVDGDGKETASFGWTQAMCLGEGLVAVAGPCSNPPAYVWSGHLEPGTAWGYRDLSNKSVIEPQFGFAGPFSEGLAVVSSDSAALGIGDIKDPRFFHPEKFKYIDKVGKTVIAGPFMEARSFKGGLAAVMMDGKWGYVDRSGKVVVPCKYSYAGDFTGDLAPVEENLLVGYIDKQGAVVIPFKFKNGMEFSNGLAPATVDGADWGYIDTRGEFKIEPLFRRTFPFSGDRALVMTSPSAVKLTASNASYFLASAVNARLEMRLNEARALCLDIIKADSKSSSAESAEHLLKVALLNHDVPEKALEYYVEGVQISARGELQEAQTLYRKALELDPAFYHAYGALSYIQTALGHADEAINSLDKALKINPDYARGYWRLSLAYKAKGDKKKAAQAMERAKQLDPEDPAFVE